MIYLDHAASSPLRPVALAAWQAAATAPGNAASLHAAGRVAARRVEQARAQVAALFGRPAREVIFTAGGTEANNLAVLGAAHALAAAGRPRVAARSAIEHASVREPYARLAAEGWHVTPLPVDGDGRVVGDAPGVSLVSVMAVNNEMGAVQAFGRARAPGAVLHVDAVQAAAYLDLAALDADLVSISAHKLGGPQGVGALWVRPGTPLAAVLLGGAHERGLRPGTLPVAALAGFAAAAAEARAQRDREAARLAALRDALLAGVVAAVPGVRALGRPGHVAPHVLMLVVPGVVGEALVEQLDMAGVAASTGAACTVLGGEPSPVLPALGLDEAAVQGSLRLSLGWSTTAEDVEQAVATIARVVATLAAMKPMAT